MKIFTPEIHKNISQLQEDLYSNNSISIDDYLKNTFAILNNNFRDHFERKYLFGKLYFRDNINNTPRITDFFDNKNADSKISNIFSNGIKLLEKKVENGLSKSLSVVIIERFLRGIVFYKGEKPEEIPSIIIQNFADNNKDRFIDELSSTSQVIHSDFDQNDKDGIKILFDGHRGMADNSKLQNVYSYLIRTRTFGKEFNGVLYLVLQRDLRTSEYSDIADLLTFILEIFSRIKNRPEVQQEEWQTLMQQQAHVNQSELKALKNMVIQINQHSTEKEKFKKIYEKTQSYINDLSDRNLMVLTMGRYKKWKLETTNINIDIPISVEECNATGYLKKTIETIEDSIDVIDNDIKRNIFIENIIPNLRELIKRIPNIYINVMLPGLKILLIERLKNTLTFADESDPIVTIYYKSDKSYHYLHFTNNKAISRADYELIKYKKVPNLEGINYRNKFGERFIREVIDFELFCTDGKWEIDIEESSTDISLQKTDIFYKIPKIKRL